MSSRPVESNKCADGASQHTFEISDVVGKQGRDLIVEWRCVDCDASFTEVKPIDGTAYVSSSEAEDEVD